MLLGRDFDAKLTVGLTRLYWILFCMGKLRQSRGDYMSRRESTCVSFGNSFFQLYFDTSLSYQGIKTEKFERFERRP
jgi:hypothetical protein